MAGDRDAGVLKNLADVLRPVGLGVRQRTRQYTRLTPLNRLVDAVLPESDTTRKFDLLVQEALSREPGAAGAFEPVRQVLAGWQENRTRLDSILRQSSLLSEILPLSGTVFELSERGLQAVNYLESGQRPPEAWLNETAMLLEASGKPEVEMLPAMIASVRALVDAAAAIR
jgi:hypothetical protein